MDRDIADERAQRSRRVGANVDARRGVFRSVLSLQRMAGNRAVARLVRDRVDAQVPAGVDAGTGLPVGSAVAGEASLVEDASLGGGWTQAGGAKLQSGRVGKVDRILLEGLSSDQSRDRWDTSGAATAGHAAAYGPGDRRHRGRAVALVPHGMNRGGGPISVIVHLHGIDLGQYAGSSGLREQGAGAEDIKFFQIPQQLEAFSARHPDARVVVLMPLGVTYGGKGRGFNVDFGIDSWDTFVDECLAQLGIAAKAPPGVDEPPATVYMSGHSGGGLTVSALGANPLKKHRFGGVFAFEAFHAGDMDRWLKLLRRHLDTDLGELQKLRIKGGDVGVQQIRYLQQTGFRFVAFGGFGGYAGRVRDLRRAILKWFDDNHDALVAATGGSAAVLDLLWRNYQAATGREDHMAALSKDSHFESALESLVSGASVSAPPQSAAHPTAQPRPAGGPAPAPPDHHAHADHKQGADEEHKGEHPPPAASKSVSKPAKHAPHPQSKQRSLQEPFQIAPYALQETPIVLIPGDDANSQKYKEKLKVKHKTEPKPGFKPDMTGIPSVFMPEILRRAKVPDPDNFFNRFVWNATFLGRPFTAPIHEHLAEHLRGVEREFADKYGGPDKDPKVAGDNLDLGSEHHAGARQASGTAAISMHMFGLAIDVNHYRNPYLKAGGEKKVPQKVFVSISQLMEGKENKLDLGASDEDAGKKYARLSAHNQMVVEYFALADPANEKDLQHKLTHAAGPWKDRDVNAARKQIEDDLKALGTATQRGNDLAMLRERGYLQLREEVVRGMKMNWGAFYGDMMHFDMRSDGDIGQHISHEIVKYLAELAKEQELAAKAAAKPAAAKANP